MTQRSSSTESSSEYTSDAENPYAKDIAAEYEHEHRDNSYYGPASTFRYRVSLVKQITDALDDADNGNLSVHLYNAYYLIRRAQKLTSQNKNTDSSDEDEDLERVAPGETWAPHPSWTSWPMKPQEVPRELTEELDTYAYDRPWPYPSEFPKPSAILEEMILAQMLKQSKLRFNQAEAELPARSEPTKVNILSGEYSRNIGNESPSPSKGPAAESDSGRGEAAESTQGDDKELDRANDNSEEATDEALPRMPFDVEITTDDEKARKIAKPVVRHLISEFEKILTALYEVRKASYLLPDKVKVSAGTVSSYHDSMAASRVAQKSHGSGTNELLSAASDDKTIRMTHPALPMDFNDVISVAALAGYDKDVLNRLTERCADLFWK